MADTSLRIGIDSTPAEAGARRVIASLKAIQAEAARAAGIKISPRIDTSSIAAAVDQVRQTLKGISSGGVDITVPVGLDTDGIDRQTADIVKRIRTEIDRNLGDGIPVDASLRVVTAAAEAEIDRVLREAEAGVDIPVDADTSRAKAEIGRLADAFGRSGAPKIRVDADVSGVVAAADEAADALAGIDDAADLRGLNAEARRAATSVKDIESAAKKAASSADGLGSAFRNAFAEVEIAEMVGEALLAIATSIGTAIVAYEDYQDAIRAATGESEAAAVAMEMVEQFALSTAFSIEDVTAAFVKLRISGLDASKESLTAYGNVAAGLNLTMEELAAAVGQAAEGNFSKLNETQLKAERSGQKVIFTYHGVKTTVDATSKAVATFIKQMGSTEFAGLMEQQAEGVTGALDAMSDAWNELARDMGDGGLNKGLVDFQKSMAQASKDGDKLGRTLGDYLGGKLTAIGGFIELAVRAVSSLVEMFKDLREAIMNIPVLSTVISGVASMRESIFSSIAGLIPPAPKENDTGAPVNPSATTTNRAFGSDTGKPWKPPSTRKTEAQRQAETFARETAENKEMIRTLVLMDEAYERGRGSVEGFRNSVEELTARQAAQKSVGKENAEAMMEQWAEIKGLQENIAIKGEVLDQQEAIMQTVALAEAYKQGSEAVDQAEASQKAWNTAVQLGVTGSPDLIAQFTELAAAAAVANDNLALEQDLSGMDQQIEAAMRLGEAYRAGGAAIREAALEQEVYAAAVSVGKEHDQEAIARIREKMTAVRDLSEARREDERAMAAGFDIEQGYAEIENLRLTGEEYSIATERLHMLMQKKRETGDATATLTAEEEQLAIAMGRMSHASDVANDALSQYARECADVQGMMRDVTRDGLGHLEDALVDIATGTKSAKEAFADMARSIAADLARMLIRMTIMRAITAAFGMPMMPMPMGPMYHTGGIVGADPVPMVRLPKFHAGGVVGTDQTSPYARLPRYHTGGLAANEVPAVLEKGEGVFTREQMKAMSPVNNNSQGQGVTVINNINVTAPPGSDKSAAESQANLIAKTVQAAVDDRIFKATRNGGILNANGGY